MASFLYCHKEETYLNVKFIHHFLLEEGTDSAGEEMWALKIYDTEGVPHDGPSFSSFLEADGWIEETFDVE